MTYYQNEFEELCTKVLGLPEYFNLEMYIIKLKEDIQKEVLKSKPADIQEPHDLALLIEGQQPTKAIGSSFTPKYKKINH